MHSKSNRYYVHVQLFEATMEQEKKFETLMPNFKYSRMINEGDVEYKLLPGHTLFSQRSIRIKYLNKPFLLLIQLVLMLTFCLPL